MPDMLVRLYDDLPDYRAEQASLAARGVVCRRAEAWEASVVLRFVRQHFPHWEDEVAAAFGRAQPPLFIAVEANAVIGFAAYNVARPNFFGPTGVDDSRRKGGVGRVLLLQCLEAFANEGYAYAIIGGVGPAAFYEKCCGATVIPGSEPGIYRNMLRA
jgi:hypothetical protein